VSEENWNVLFGDYGGLVCAVVIVGVFWGLIRLIRGKK